MLLIGFVLGPMSLGEAAGLERLSHSQHHSVPAPESTGAPAQTDHSGHHHGLAGCSAFSCAPSFVGSDGSAAFRLRLAASVRLFAINDPLLRPFCLDGDPPVPRS